ncbi:MAG: cell division protein FtsA [Victivallales bacterium]|nr:cell division protein FtsA [Victivallales bacterium]
MLKRGSSELVTAVELGNSKICVLIGESDASGNAIVLGSGERGSDGSIRKGEIQDMQKASQLFNEALSDAEESAGTEIEPHNVYVGVSGNHIRGYHGIGVAPVSNEDRRVDLSHINDALQNASVVSHSPEEMAVDVIAGHFILDGRRVETPLDQKGYKLESHCHIIYGARNHIENFMTPVKDAHIDYPVPVFSGLASAMAVVGDEEQEQGVILLDVGAGTTEYIQLYNPGVYESGAVAVGCDHIVNDLSIALELPFFPACKDILRDAADTSRVKDGFLILAGHIGQRRIPVETVNKVVSMRLGELFGIVLDRLETHGGLRQKVGSGVVLTGGGSLINRAPELANEIFKMPVRVAGESVPENFAGAVSSLNSPRYTTLLGLLNYGLRRSNKGSIISKLDRNINHILRSAWKRTKEALRI